MRSGMCQRKIPKVYEFKIIEDEKDFDGTTTFCASSVKNLVCLDERHAKPEYDDNDCGRNCEYNDDGCCLCTHACQHKQIIGYIQGNDKYTRYYPKVGDVLVYEKGKLKELLTKETFDRVYCEQATV